MSLVLICTIIVIGVTAGLTTFRNQVVLEFGDLAAAIESLDQSYDAGPYGTHVDSPPPSSPMVDFP
jgi:hypothetical protein